MLSVLIRVWNLCCGGTETDVCVYEIEANLLYTIRIFDWYYKSHRRLFVQSMLNLWLLNSRYQRNVYFVRRCKFTWSRYVIYCYFGFLKALFQIGRYIWERLSGDKLYLLHVKPLENGIASEDSCESEESRIGQHVLYRLLVNKQINSCSNINYNITSLAHTIHKCMRAHTQRSREHNDIILQKL